MELGPNPGMKSTLGAKVGVVAPVVVVLRKMPLLRLARKAKSGLPSLLKSPMLMAPGLLLVPVFKSILGAKVGVVAPLVVVFSRIEMVLLP